VQSDEIGKVDMGQRSFAIDRRQFCTLEFSAKETPAFAARNPKFLISV
jgi:hypothetical protein